MKSQINNFDTSSIKPFPPFRNMVIAGFIFSCLILVASLGYGVIEKETKERISEHLQSTLNANIQAVRLWRKDKITDARVLANDDLVRRNIFSLVQKAGGKNWSKKQLLATPEATFLREKLGKASTQHGFIGFVLFDKTGYQILALLDNATGKADLKAKSDFFERALNGEAVVTAPFESEIPLPDVYGEIHPEFPTMFSAVPIRDSSGNVIAVLSFRVRPEIEFNRLMFLSRFGESGETYSFDRQGLLLSESRFNDHLKNIGLLPDTSNWSMLKIHLRDPGVDLTQGHTSELPREKQPHTLMAGSAVKGEKGLNVDGYNDYRGVKVIGAWAWLPDAGFGMTTEVDYREAYSSLKVLEKIFLTLFGLILGFALVALYFNFKNSKTEAQLENAKKLKNEGEVLLSTLVENVVDGIITMSQNGIVQSFSPGAEMVFGYSRDEVIGKNIKMLMDGEHKMNHDRYLERYLITGERRILGVGREVTGVKKDGTLIHIDLSVSGHKMGDEIWFTGICRDISERKKAEEEREVALLSAENANKAKSQFLARMSHELRTPMNAILGFGQLLQMDSSLKASHKESLDQILKSGDHLLNLINDVLDISKIEADELSIRIESIQVKPLFEQIMNLTLPMALEHGIKVENILPNDFNPGIKGDLTRVRQVLVNLMTNAVKYNRENGSITLDAHLAENEMVELEIADTGKGISKENMEKLFQPFDRLGAENSSIEGTGIGLTICHELMKLMKGDIKIESRIGQGSKFTLCFPKADFSGLPLDLPKPDCIALAESLRRRDPTILYIEDNLSNLSLISKVLSDTVKCQLLTGKTAREGLDLAREKSPDLILLDIDLPDMHGLDVFSQLKSWDETRNIPVIAVSANAMQVDINKALNLGICEYITKPIQIREFVEKIHAYVDG